MKKIIIVLILFTSNIPLHAQTLLDEYSWVDSVYYSLSLDQQIGQLFMVRAFPKQDEKELSLIRKYIDSLHIGGIIFFQGSPSKQLELTVQFQNRTKTPLLIGIDGEWGFGMRFPESVMKFPKQMTLGAIANDELIYEMGSLIAKQCKKMGVHLNFAPVIDINNNPLNPVINERAFGEDKFYVTAKALAYMRGLQDNGVIATAKHFPGHGDTHVDSHKDLPTINHSMSRLKDIELFPFRALIKEGVQSIMVGHLNLPNLDNRPFRSATVSYNIVTNLLKEELGYRGLIITDAMEMKGVAKNFSNGNAELEAFLAGNDLILMPDNLVAAYNKIKKAVLEGTIYPSRLEESVRKILHAKYKAKAFVKPVMFNDVVGYLNNNEAVGLKTKLIESSITLVKDNDNLLPIRNFNGRKIMALGIGIGAINSFHKRLSNFTEIKSFVTKKEVTNIEFTKLVNEAAKHELVIISTHDHSRQQQKNYGITQSSINLIKEIAKKTKVVFVLFGNPYALKDFQNLSTIVVAYEEDDLFQDITAQSIFGVSAFNGKLPVSSGGYVLGGGISKNKSGILGEAIPEAVGLDTEVLKEIDDISKEIIRKKAAPGCVVLVAKDNKIVYHKAFGNQIYNIPKPVDKNDVYDLASLTKILSGSLALMKLVDENKIGLSKTISTYIPELSNTDKANINLADMLSHHGRLIPFIPFYEETIIKKNKKVTLPSSIYSTVSMGDYNVPIATNLWMKSNYQDTVWKRVYNSPLRERDGYKYSDLGFMMVKKIVENTAKIPLDKYVEINFYKPLGLTRTMYNPTKKLSLSNIVPTEIDDYWRGKTVHGTVHDMAAAMLGGVSGHAGLFSNAKEVAIIMQMLLNGGSYAGNKLINEGTVESFITRHYRSTRRGLGFDLKELDTSQTMNMSELAPQNTFGHTGFTGTCAYADPTNNIVYVFLSNRTYPDMDNNTLNKNEYRIKIQSVIYKALKK